MGLMKEAWHLRSALAFINLCLRTETAASVTNEMFQPSGNAAAVPFLKPEIAGSRYLNMSAE